MDIALTALLSLTFTLVLTLLLFLLILKLRKHNSRVTYLSLKSESYAPADDELDEDEKPEVKRKKSRPFWAPLFRKSIKYTIKGIKSLKPTKPEHYFVAALYLLVFAAAIYFAWPVLFQQMQAPFQADTYEISAGNIQLFDKLKSFYIDKASVLGAKEEIGNKTARKITSAEAFNAVFSPKLPFSNTTKANLEINLIGNESDVYLNENLIFPKLNGYSLLKEYKDYYVFIRNSSLSYLNRQAFDSQSNPESAIYSGLPMASVYLVGDENLKTPEITGYKQGQSTAISTRFRDNLNLAFYIEGNLDIQFIKQDLNNYAGKDEYGVEIKDYNGKSLFKQIYGDDGDTAKSGEDGKGQDFKIYLPNLQRGIYYISFTKDKYNPSSDSTIKNFSINTNKVLIDGASLPWESFNLYTKLFRPGKIGFNYWWADKDQAITTSGDADLRLVLDKSCLSKTCNLDFEKAGEYTIRSPKGFLWVYSDYLSTKKESWFDMPFVVKSATKDVDFIVIRKENYNIKTNEIHYIKEIILDSKTKKFSVKVVDEDKIYLESIKLSIIK